MFTIFRIGLLLVCVVVVTADLEFAMKSLFLHFRDIGLPKPNEGTMDYELVNENVRVPLERTDVSLLFPSEMDFNIQTERAERQLNNRRLKITPECNGIPGLYLKNPPKQGLLSNLPFIAPKTSPLKTLFCFSGVNFQYLRDRDLKPVMEITAKFLSKEDEYKALLIIMPVFLPPVEEAEIKLAKEHDVLRNVCPIPPDQFDTPGLAPRKEGDEEKQHFVGDIAWLKDVLPRAKRLEGNNEWYYPGPVIIERELYDKIIELDYMFKLHAFGKEPVRRKRLPRFLRSKIDKLTLGFRG